jgi:hypothetical protein
MGDEVVGIGNTPKYKHDWHINNRERMLQKMKDRYDSMKDKPEFRKTERIRQKKYYCDNVKKESIRKRVARKNNLEHFTKQSHDSQQRLRLKALNIVGRGKLQCSNCGIIPSNIRLLEINHINGGGYKEVGTDNHKFYRLILSGKRPTDDLNILCKLCNQAHFIERNFGVKYNIEVNSNG